jgi:hypothetical protein
LLKDITLENIGSMYELSEAFHAISLRHRCILFILEQFDKLSDKPRFVALTCVLALAKRPFGNELKNINICF